MACCGRNNKIITNSYTEYSQDMYLSDPVKIYVGFQSTIIINGVIYYAGTMKMMSERAYSDLLDKGANIWSL